MAAFPTITTKLPQIPSEDFTKEKVLGQGGFGKVYFGRWDSVPVAVKELLVQTISDTFIKTFRSEAEMMASCQHPNTVRLYGICLEEGKLALLMEYLDKGSLYSLLRNTAIPLSWPERLSIATDTASGLSYLHNLKIVHRDLKSLNVLLAKDGTAKIADFGLAQIRLETSSKMTTGQPSGSPRWMAPEQFIQSAPASSLTDIYSLGMIFWEIASRSIPYSHLTNEYIVIAAKMNSTHETIPSDTPENYAALIKNCWKSPQERPTAKMLAKELVALQTKNPPLPSLHISSDTSSYRSNTLGPVPPKPSSFLPSETLSYVSNTLAPPPKPVVMSPLPKSSLPAIAFGKEQWAKYFGDIGVEPPPPSDIDTILSSPCPFWPNKKVEDTHLLILVPQTVNGKALTLKLLEKLIQKPLQGKPIKYRSLDLGEYTDISTTKSYWVLLTRDVIEGSRGKAYSLQQALIQGKKDYEEPTILDATVAILMEHARTGTKLYSDKPWTYTRCQEKWSKNRQLVVGGFSDYGLYSGDGLYVFSYYSDDVFGSVGVGGMRKFY